MPSSKLLPIRQSRAGVALTASLLLLLCACAGLSRSPEAGRPQPNAPPYPVILTSSNERPKSALAAWTRLAGQVNGQSAAAPDLQPVTATVRALPAGQGAPPLYLPKVGEETEGRLPNEEETREALRRFIADARPLLGVAPENLSLAEQTETAGIKTAVYEQKPFSHPLRGGYGLIKISFAADRRIVELTSTAIPEAERIERGLLAVRPQLTAADVAARLAGRAVTLDGTPPAAAQTITLTNLDEKMVGDLVIYPTRAGTDTATLDFHLAWEVTTTGATPLNVYVDAVTGETLGAQTAAARRAPTPQPAQ